MSKPLTISPLLTIDIVKARARASLEGLQRELEDEATSDTRSIQIRSAIKTLRELLADPDDQERKAAPWVE